ncbi:hypothetical protein BJ322DRAFT_1023563 [Thelephora terrestris]|uniref:Uncharacterized protein n=1 Tax=Thelephora terrestris TaxID=56493 RepID=A0A9P6H710_9AGAM|nr:hypothetical protein BJ322DRAFT_1023563 [Thelephora terrestris]
MCSSQASTLGEGATDGHNPTGGNDEEHDSTAEGNNIDRSGSELERSELESGLRLQLTSDLRTIIRRLLGTSDEEDEEGDEVPQPPQDLQELARSKKRELKGVGDRLCRRR